MQTKNRITSFTSGEFLSVIVIIGMLGILAAFWIPQFNAAAAESKEAALAGNIKIIRQAIELYQIQHDGVYPSRHIVGQLTSITDHTGIYCASDMIHDSTFRYGPYLTFGFPLNPVNGLSDVLVVPQMPNGPVNSFVLNPMTTDLVPAKADDRTTGWIYATDTGEFRANTPGMGPSGTPYFDL